MEKIYSSRKYEYFNLKTDSSIIDNAIGFLFRVVKMITIEENKTKDIQHLTLSKF